MSKRATLLKGPEIMLDQHVSVPLYRQLYERLRGSILSGQLEAGTRLPSTRVLASELGVSRTTTALAYEMLLLEGYIESRVGDGTRVADLHLGQVFQGKRECAGSGRKQDSGDVLHQRSRGTARRSSTCRVQKYSTGSRRGTERACFSLASRM